MLIAAPHYMLHHPFPIIVALGANMGSPQRNFDLALRLLERGGVHVLKRSRLYWTRPWGVIDQPPFLNAAVSVRTSLSPADLMARCLHVEAQMGRRRSLKWGARPIDLDLLIYGGIRQIDSRLHLPHPGIAQRDFVLAPLIDLRVPPLRSIAPRGWAHLLNQMSAQERTILHSEPWK